VGPETLHRPGTQTLLPRHTAQLYPFVPVWGQAVTMTALWSPSKALLCASFLALGALLQYTLGGHAAAQTSHRGESALELLRPAAAELAASELFTQRPAGTQVYIDIGSNNGMSVLRFLGFPDMSGVLDASTPYHGKGQWHIVMLEANPMHTQRLQGMAQYLTAFGHTVQLLTPMALSTQHGGNVSFYLDTPDAATYAASIVAGANSHTGEKVTVPTVDIDYLCSTFVLDGLMDSDYVVVKMDVEGAEYDILLQAIAAGIPALWDELYVEFHEDNNWVLKGTALEQEARRKRALVERQMVEQFGLRVGVWDR
jgi:FkbM family methyltransferase